MRTDLYTVRPIQRWPNEMTADRGASQFQREGLYTRLHKLLDRELWHLDAESVVLQVACQESDIRRDGLLRARAKVKHPGVILAFESCYGPLSLPCDTYLIWEENLYAIAKVLEANRMINRYGVGQSTEQYTGWLGLPNLNEEEALVINMDHRQAWEYLAEVAGVSGDVNSISEDKLIKMAQKKSHPDTGGSAEAFQKVQRVAEVLKAGG